MKTPALDTPRLVLGQQASGDECVEKACLVGLAIDGLTV